MRPDVMVLGPEWPERALLCAQLIEDGYEVVGIDAWPIPRTYRRPETRPRIVVVDLRGLAEPRAVLDDLRYVMPPNRVIVIAALGTIDPEVIRGLGYHVVARPTTIRDVAAAVRAALG